jgi:hypothetical protein
MDGNICRTGRNMYECMDALLWSLWGVPFLILYCGGDVMSTLIARTYSSGV